MLGKVDAKNDRMDEVKLFYERKLGKEVDSPGELMCMVAADCIAMFPSMRRGYTSRIIGDLICESYIQFEEFSWKEAARYVCLTCQPSEIQISGLGPIMPTRRYNKGPKPGFNTRDVHSKKIDSDSQ